MPEPASDQIRNLICGLPSSIRSKRYLVMLKGFFDESGSRSGEVYVLSGFFSTPDRWMTFSDEWQKICEKPPKTSDFKMRQAVRLKEYGWTEPQRDARIKELVDLICKEAMYRVDAVTAHPDYERIVRGKIPKDLDDPYFILFLNAIFAITEFMDLLEIDEPIEFVFDHQEAKIEEQCFHWFQWIKQNALAAGIQRRLVDPPEFKHDKDVLPLKSADIFAWQIRRHLNMEQPQGVGLNDILESLLGMHGVSCNVRPHDLIDLVYAIEHGLNIRSNAGYFLPNSATVINNLKKRRMRPENENKK